MATTNEDLHRRTMEIYDSYFAKPDYFEKVVQQAVKEIDLTKIDDNYKPARTIFGAICEKIGYAEINGSCNERVRRQQRKLANEVKAKVSLIQS